MANIFSKKSNSTPRKILIAMILVLTALTAAFTYYATPKYTNVGYQPIQPVPFDHSLHVGQLGLDCRYCHTSVDKSGTAGIPATSTCMNCHATILPDSAALAPVRESYASGKPVPWVRIHNLPDYVYFNHSVHVNRGISCVECHGQVNEMSIVHQDKSLSMLFCLECHRDPAAHIRPLDQVYNLEWKPKSEEAQRIAGTGFVHDWKVHPPESCSGCHR
jgi:hypothetical protein